MDYRTTSDQLLAAATVSPGRPRVDNRVAMAAEERLQASSHVALRGLVCEFRAGVLVLRGQVSSHYLRQLAQESVRAIEGVEEVINLVEVVSPSRE